MNDTCTTNISDVIYAHFSRLPSLFVASAVSRDQGKVLDKESRCAALTAFHVRMEKLLMKQVTQFFLYYDKNRRDAIRFAIPQKCIPVLFVWKLAFQTIIFKVQLWADLK